MKTIEASEKPLGFGKEKRRFLAVFRSAAFLVFSSGRAEGAWHRLQYRRFLWGRERFEEIFSNDDARLRQRRAHKVENAVAF